MPLPLFCYGTLQSPLVMHALVGQTYLGTGATLLDYRIYRVRGTEYPGIFPEKGSIVMGTLYQNIDDPILQILDNFEGDQYIREIVQVNLEDSNSQEAYMYSIDKNRRDLLSQEGWDYDTFVKNELDAYIKRCFA